MGRAGDGGTIYTTQGFEEVEFATSVRLFEAGDAIVVGLIGGSYGLTVIGRLNSERMLCTSFGPAFPTFPDDAMLDAWWPDGWSSWMADTLGLRDGSWTKVKTPAAMAELQHIDVRALPRFIFTCAKTGEFKVAVYDPETLFVTQIIDGADPEDYRGAPSFLPQDATTFEIALSRHLGSPAELPDEGTVKLLNDERLVVALLRERVTDRSNELTFDHVLDFKHHRDAKRVRAELVTLGFEVSDPAKAGLFSRTILEVRLRCKAEYPLVREDVRRMRRIAEEYGAVYDGFGAQAV